MDKLGVTIGGVPFDHMVYHFVLTYSNWETGSICFSESFESLSHGLQNALWKLGGVPHRHRTDCLASAVNKETYPEEFTRRYQDLMDHYGLTPSRTIGRYDITRCYCIGCCFTKDICYHGLLAE